MHVIFHFQVIMLHYNSGGKKSLESPTAVSLQSFKPASFGLLVLYYEQSASACPVIFYILYCEINVYSSRRDTAPPSVMENSIHNVQFARVTF